MNIEKLKSELIRQKNSKFKGNIYHYSQVNFAYNSNKIEGTHLSEDETEEIFVTNSYIPKEDDVVKLDDLIEMNKIIKRGTSDEDNPRYNVGGFKIVPNKIGLINVLNTSSPKDTPKDIDNLLSWYNSIENVTLEDIIEFHYRFEKIHPFGSGNGRVGRMIMFKECLKNNIMPFIVLDNDKPFYLRGLNNYEIDKMFLIDTVKHEQDLYEIAVNDMLDFEI